MKRLLILLIAIPLLSSAQEKLYVQGTSPDLYINHTVAPKEGFYKIARLYNVNPHALATYDSISFDKGPNIGQTIKIPLTADNFSQDDKVGDDEELIPVYHIIQEKEGLYHLSTMYNKVPISQFKKWNNMQGESLNKGAAFIIGYLKVKKGSAATISSASPVVTATVVNNSAAVTPVLPPPPAKTPASENDTLAAVVTPKKETAVKPKPVQKQAVVQDNDNTETVTTTTKTILTEGIFKDDYLKQTAKNNTETETGTAASFKSSSGWVDGKYYCLQNNAPAGAIVKVTNTDNGKTIYAKVLEPMPDASQNADLVILISNAAAEALGAAKGAKLNCTLEYSK